MRRKGALTILVGLIFEIEAGTLVMMWSSLPWEVAEQQSIPRPFKACVYVVVLLVVVVLCKAWVTLRCPCLLQNEERLTKVRQRFAQRHTSMFDSKNQKRKACSANERWGALRMR